MVHGESCRTGRVCQRCGVDEERGGYLPTDFGVDLTLWVGLGCGCGLGWLPLAM